MVGFFQYNYRACDVFFYSQEVCVKIFYRFGFFLLLPECDFCIKFAVILNIQVK